MGTSARNIAAMLCTRRSAKPDRQHGFHDPAMGEPAGIGRFLADVVGLQDVGNGKLEQDGDDDHHQNGRDELDGALQPLRKSPKQNVDLHVAVLEDGVGEPQHADGRHQVPLELLHSDRAGAEEIAQQHVVGHHHHDRERTPARNTTNAIDDGIERVGNRRESPRHFLPRNFDLPSWPGSSRPSKPASTCDAGRLESGVAA